MANSPARGGGAFIGSRWVPPSHMYTHITYTYIIHIHILYRYIIYIIYAWVYVCVCIYVPKMANFQPPSRPGCNTLVGCNTARRREQRVPVTPPRGEAASLRETKPNRRRGARCDGGLQPLPVLDGAEQDVALLGAHLRPRGVRWPEAWPSETSQSSDGFILRFYAGNHAIAINEKRTT